MAVTEIPARKIFTCDGCSDQKDDRLPANWQNWHLKANALDFQGAAVADASRKLLLCSTCASVASKAINEAIAERRKAIHALKDKSNG